MSTRRIDRTDERTGIHCRTKANTSTPQATPSHRDVVLLILVLLFFFFFLFLPLSFSSCARQISAVYAWRSGERDCQTSGFTEAGRMGPETGTGTGELHELSSRRGWAATGGHPRTRVRSQLRTFFILLEEKFEKNPFTRNTSTLFNTKWRVRRR